MTKTIITISSLIFAASASAASPFLEGPNDLYSGMQDSAAVPTAAQPGVGDTYGGNAFEKNDLLGSARYSSSIPEGSGDAYGSPIPNVQEGTLTW